MRTEDEDLEHLRTYTRKTGKRGGAKRSRQERGWGAMCPVPGLMRLDFKLLKRLSKLVRALLG